LEQLKQSGKVRYVGVSLYNEGDIDYVLKQSVIDGFQVKFGLLDPMPLLSRLTQIENSGLGVIVRSSLKEGFLTGKFKPGVSFSAANDQRSEWTAGQIAMTLKQVEALRFLETAERSLLCSAIHYPLQFSAVSTVIVGTKNDQQAKANFTDSGVVSFTDDEMESIQRLQRKMGLLYNPDGGLGRVSALMATVKKRLF
jgi:aryl-alcohol dehydrogenase-like predicted oxidoreductase